MQTSVFVPSAELKARGQSPFCAARDSAIHGTGVFATQALREDQKVIEYVGELIDKDESHRRGWEQMERGQETGGPAVLIFTLDDTHDIDGGYDWNLARLINHSCDPNCYSQVIEGEIWVLAARAIQPGEELTFNYGFALDHWQDHPCRCGQPNCIGYIVGFEHWDELREILAKKAEAAS